MTIKTIYLCIHVKERYFWNCFWDINSSWRILWLLDSTCPYTSIPGAIILNQHQFAFIKIFHFSENLAHNNLNGASDGTSLAFREATGPTRAAPHPSLTNTVLLQHKTTIMGQILVDVRVANTSFSWSFLFLKTNRRHAVKGRCVTHKQLTFQIHSGAIP